MSLTIVRLSKQGIVRRVVVHGKVYLSLEDVKEYGQDPEGYLNPQDATRESGYSHDVLKRFAKKGRIRATTRHGIVYFFDEDIQGLKVPEGFLSLEKAAIQSNFSIYQIKYRIKANRIGSIKRGGKRYVSAEDLGIHAETQESNASPEATLEDRIENEIINAIN